MVSDIARFESIARRRPDRLPPFSFALALRMLAGLAVLMLSAIRPDVAHAEPPPLTIAVVATVGSPHQPHGDEALAAARDAVDTINRRGGLLGRKLHLLARSEDCTSATAETIAYALTALPPLERPLAVIGHLCSGAAIAAGRIYSEAGLLMISSGARHPRLTDQRTAPLIFRLAGRDDRIGVDVAALIADRFAGRRVALVHDRSAQSRGLTDAVDQELRQRGIRPALREAYIHGEKSYAPLVDRLIQAEAEVIFLPAQPIELGIILARLAELRQRATVIASDVVAVPEIEAVGRAAGSRLIVMLPWLQTSPQPTHKLWSEPTAPSPVIPNDAQKSARSPVWQQTHAAVMAWASAVLKSTSTDTASIVRALETEAAATVAGPIRFDTRGDAVVTSFVPWTWRDGGWSPLAP